jgi:D-3-phosphoglycerate dehydrogenase
VKKVGLFGSLHPSLKERLAQYELVCETEPDRILINEVIADLDGIVIRSPFKLDSAAAGAARRLRWIVRAGSGTDNISPAFRARGVEIRAVPANAASVAELAIGLSFALIRHVRAGHESLRRGIWMKSTLLGDRLARKTMGILGFGRIGQEVARLARAIDVDVVAFDRSPHKAEKQQIAQRYSVGFLPLDALLAVADVVVACLPGAPETSGLLDASRLGLMKKTALLINVGRGSLIELDVLYRNLVAGQLAGAALDVFSQEPPGVHPIFELNNVICTPHLGAQTHDAQLVIADQVVAHVQELVSRRETPGFARVDAPVEG